MILLFTVFGVLYLQKKFKENEYDYELLGEHSA